MLNHPIKLSPDKLILFSTSSATRFFLVIVDEQQDRYLVIRGGLPEAGLVLGLQRVDRRVIRPSSHQVLLSVIEESDLTIEDIQIGVGDSRDVGGFLNLVGREKSLTLECAPFDAVILGYITSQPILVEEKLLNTGDFLEESQEEPSGAFFSSTPENRREGDEDNKSILPSGEEFQAWIRRIEPKEFE